MAHPPTPEQTLAVDAYTTGQDLVLVAGAGTGKTATLALMAGATPRSGTYIAFNKAIADEAKGRMPRNFTCRTVHSHAYAAIGRDRRDRLGGPRMSARDTAKVLRIAGPARIDPDRAPLAPQQVARLVMDTVRRFCISDNDTITRRHVPPLAGLDTPRQRDTLANLIVPFAQRAWADLARPQGRLPYNHDHYRKEWALTRPTLPGECVMLDEAQDTAPVLSRVFNEQRVQRVAVGDPNQSIYGWAGAVDALDKIAGARRLYLTRSWRFGDAIADEANGWLALLGDMRLSGNPHMQSTVGRVDGHPDAVLCRSNAGAMDELVGYHTAGVPVAIVGGGKQLRDLAEAAQQLQAGGGTWHPELCAFTTWGSVQEYADSEEGQDLAAFVRLIDKRGAGVVIDAVDRAVDERHAQVTVSTAHKAKGRQWLSVRVADDFYPPKDDEDGNPQEVPRETAMLAYVTVTRARERLEVGGLGWLAEHMARLTARDPEPVL